MPPPKHLDNIEAPSCETSNSHGLVRQLARRYLLVLAAIAGLVAADQVVVQPLLAKMGRYAPVINMAGRQRMLSQKLVKAALALHTADDEAARHYRCDELRDTLAAWSAANSALRFGDESRGIAKIDSPAIQHEWQILDPHFDAMCAAADKVVRSYDRPSNDILRTSIDTIVEYEGRFLTSMDRIVSLMEREAADSVRRLRACAAAIATTIILLLIGLGWYVIRPATRSIRGQVDMLEVAVSDRTRALSETLAALRHEIKQRELADLKSQRMTAQLAHADRVYSLGHLAGGLAHELNHPLATIANYAEACDLELARVPACAQKDRLANYFGKAKEAALRAGKIVGRMRSFVRPDSANVTQADVNQLICEVLELCQAEVAKADVEVLVDLRGEAAVVECDTIQVQQVLVNLIQNALQAMLDTSEGQRRLEVKTSAVGDSIHVSVIDSGRGFASTDPDTLFASFNTSKRNGLGIGLAICRSIVEQHGGSIWVESPCTGGARVIFSLPLVKSYAAARSELTECVCR